jgi:hypothetical protein
MLVSNTFSSSFNAFSLSFLLFLHPQLKSALESLKVLDRLRKETSIQPDVDTYILVTQSLCGYLHNRVIPNEPDRVTRSLLDKLFALQQDRRDLNFVITPKEIDMMISIAADDRNIVELAKLLEENTTNEEPLSRSTINSVKKALVHISTSVFQASTLDRTHRKVLFEFTKEHFPNEVKDVAVALGYKKK